MRYESPTLNRFELYEAPQLLDVAALAANASDFCYVCLTAGVEFEQQAEVQEPNAI